MSKIEEAWCRFNHYTARKASVNRYDATIVLMFAPSGSAERLS